MGHIFHQQDNKIYNFKLTNKEKKEIRRINGIYKENKLPLLMKKSRSKKEFLNFGRIYILHLERNLVIGLDIDL